MENKMNPKEARIKILLDLHILLDKYKIEHWLSAGTLLGAYREKAIIQWDRDVDIACHVKDYWRFRKVINESLDWAFYKIWRREIAVCKYGTKIDIYFAETDENKLYIYSYKKSNYTKHWDIEQRQIFTKDNFFPLKKINFLGVEFLIPKNTEAVLIEHYGDWKTPNPNWTCKEIKWDKNHRQIGIIIPTFLRDEKMMTVINSLLETYDNDWFRIYVGDQAGIGAPPAKAQFYEELKNKGHKVFALPYNCGLAYTRKFLIEQSKEPMLLIVDDDFIFDKGTNLNNFIYILLSEEKLGIIGGELRNYCRQEKFSYSYNLYYDPKIPLIQKIEFKPQWLKSILSRNQRPIDYYHSDLILNFFLAKKEVFDNVKYDPKFPLLEHLDFFLRLKMDNNWKVGLTKTVSVVHNPKPNSVRYGKFREADIKKNKIGINVKKGFDRFIEKYKINPFKIQLIKEKKK